MDADKLLASLKEATGDAAKEFESELKEYAEKITKSLTKIEVAKLDGDQIKLKKYKRNLLHLQGQLKMKGMFCKAKAKKKGYDVVKGTLKLVVDVLVGALIS